MHSVNMGPFAAVAIFSVFLLLEYGSTQNISTIINISITNDAGTEISTKQIQSTALVENVTQPNAVVCRCAVLLAGQFIKENPTPLVDEPLFVMDIENQQYQCDKVAWKKCTVACIRNLTKYLPQNAEIVCSLIDRDCFKEKGYLFVNSCYNGWLNTKLMTGMYCCKNNEVYDCV